MKDIEIKKLPHKSTKVHTTDYQKWEEEELTENKTGLWKVFKRSCVHKKKIYKLKDFTERFYNDLYKAIIPKHVTHAEHSTRKTHSVMIKYDTAKQVQGN